jgi:TatA/E family protein of Tat protein translocase
LGTTGLEARGYRLEATGWRLEAGGWRLGKGGTIGSALLSTICEGRFRAEGAFAVGSLGLPELLVILFIVILIFGSNKLPQLGRGVGSAIKNFKEGMNDDTPPKS